MNIKKSEDAYVRIGTLNDDGFLRVKINYAKVGVLPYLACELPGFEDRDPNSTIFVLRSKEAVFDPESIKSLEGVPLLIDHTWLFPGIENAVSGQTPEQSPVIVGSVAGTPKKNGDLLTGSGLITNEYAIARIQTEDLIEISPAYTRKVIKQDGVFRRQQTYEAVFRDIRYNHVALIPSGMGRGGRELRISNDKKLFKGGKAMSTENLVKVQTFAGIVDVSQDSVPVIERVLKSCTEKDKNLSISQDSIKTFEEQLKSFDEMKGELEKVKGEKDAIELKNKELEASLDKMQTPEAVEAAIKDAVEVKQMAEAMAVSFDSKEALPAGWEKMRTDILRQSLVESYCKVMGKSLDKELLTPQYIGGMWDVLKDTYLSKEVKGVPVNFALDKAPVPAGNAPKERSIGERLGYKPEKNVKE